VAVALELSQSGKILWILSTTSCAYLMVIAKASFRHVNGMMEEFVYSNLIRLFEAATPAVKNKYSKDEIIRRKGCFHEMLNNSAQKTRTC
jgi:hypothetical protein